MNFWQFSLKPVLIPMTLQLIVVYFINVSQKIPLFDFESQSCILYFHVSNVASYHEGSLQ